MKNTQQHWSICLECQGRGQKSKRIRKKAKLQYKREVIAFEKNNCVGDEPIKPKGHLDTCPICEGSGLRISPNAVNPDSDTYPNIAIVGGGIGGVALAVACLHRGIPFTLYERDSHFEQRSQGYGLTLQQASRAIQALGIVALKNGVISTRHVVHNAEGRILGEWGIRKWGVAETNASPKRTNIHIARQSLRAALLEQLHGNDAVKWGHQLVDVEQSEGKGAKLSFYVDGHLKHATADLVVGADGIRSKVRKLHIDEESSPLCYLGCIVILGICPLSKLEGVESDLLDSATVFQTANGNERIYMMPFTSDSVMWQLSFPMTETEAQILSKQGLQALKDEAIKRCQWHQPIPQILNATHIDQISGYPVYDRALMDAGLLAKADNVTLIGDAAHPMSPFKGQGANQALLDALLLGRLITKHCRPLSNWRQLGIRIAVLNEFESDMFKRSVSKVKDSAEAAKYLHSEVALYEGNEPRGRCLNKRGGE
jgi:2-polyprenyl-6-methoxyphenol hydroxylase-like FAD-dependent oxidoreductase